ncbi:hypothetical protein AGLY_000401 [Aphis glycines]|uniref:N-acetylglucosamine-6-phosphate deacetylase n=2 Tax=Aphis glycines TaxID=307491 RepID=A0A6G0U6W1_APHGL|nr:hypothetical protein AGLY_000401 [Aphis glycines]
MNIVTKYFNCNILKDGKILTQDLWVVDGRIANPEIIFYDKKKIPDVEIDCLGSLITPGFIDLQINGAFGVDFTYHKGDGLDIVKKGLLQYGVTGFCPTIILPKFKRCNGNEQGAAILGAHVEGPFISKLKHGAHSIFNIKTLENSNITDTYGSLNNIAIVTLAPELNGSMETIKLLSNQGIVVSLGHTSSDMETSIQAVKNGATFITHLFNAMLSFHHRDPGLIGLIACPPSVEKPLFFGIIADGTHTHPTALKIAHKINSEGLVLVTDALSAIGLPDGIHYLGDKQIEVKNSKAYIANTNTLCGSVTPLDECMRYFLNATNCSVAEAIETITLHPAKVLGIQQFKGTLNYGADADFVFLGNKLNVQSTWINGQCVFKHSSGAGYIEKKNNLNIS